MCVTTCQWWFINIGPCYGLVASGTTLTHWGRATHICVSKLTIIGSDNGLSPCRRQAIIWTNAGTLLIRPLATNFSEISIEIHIFSFKNIHLKMSSGKWRPFCLSLSVLSNFDPVLGHHITSAVQWHKGVWWLHIQSNILKGPKVKTFLEVSNSPVISIFVLCARERYWYRVNLLLTHWRYFSLSQNHRYTVRKIWSVGWNCCGLLTI